MIEIALISLQEVPDEIGLLTSRTVVPVMLALRVRRPLNMLNAEALAVALLAGAELIVTTESPLFRQAPPTSACRTKSSADLIESLLRLNFAMTSVAQNQLAGLLAERYGEPVVVYAVWCAMDVS